MNSDSISDFISRIKNGYLARHKTVEADFAKVLLEIGKILAREKFIKEIKVETENNLPAGRQGRKILVVTLSYPNRKPALTDIKRVSKPGLRLYARRNRIPVAYGGIGLTILSTPQGIMDNREAKKRKIGGEVVCKVW